MDGWMDGWMDRSIDRSIMLCVRLLRLFYPHDRDLRWLQAVPRMPSDD